MPRTGSGTGASHASVACAKLVRPSPAACWNQLPVPVMVVDPASEMTLMPMTMKAIATRRFTLFVWRVNRPARKVIALALPHRR